MTKDHNYKYRDIGSFTIILNILLGVGALVSAVCLFSLLMQVQLLFSDGLSAASAEANDTRVALLGSVQLWVYLITVLVFGWWIIMANKNVWAFGAKEIRITPGWALAYFFIPIAYLWKPYEAMRDLWRASYNPTSWMEKKTSAILPTWWALWIASNLFGHLSISLIKNAKTISDYQTMSLVEVFGQMIEIPLCLVAMALVNQITAAQQKYINCSEASC